jgi:hypothetical protein
MQLSTSIPTFGANIQNLFVIITHNTDFILSVKLGDSGMFLFVDHENINGNVTSPAIFFVKQHL